MSLFPVSAIWDGQAACHRRGPPYSSSMLRNWLNAYEKGIKYCLSPPQTPQDISKSLPHPISNKGIAESDCEINFPFIHSPSVPCWQHKRIGSFHSPLGRPFTGEKHLFAFVWLFLGPFWRRWWLCASVSARLCCDMSPTGGVMNTVCSGSLLLGTPWAFAADKEDKRPKILLP